MREKLNISYELGICYIQSHRTGVSLSGMRASVYKKAMQIASKTARCRNQFEKAIDHKQLVNTLFV